MKSLRKLVLTALALSLVPALPAFAAPAPLDGPAGSFEKYLPDGCDGVIIINVRQLLDSPLVKKTGIDKALATEDTDKTLKALGLDPLKDIERVIVANDQEKDNDPYFIIQGKFDPIKLHAAADVVAREKKDVLKVHKTEYGRIYEVTKLEEIVKVPPQAAGAGDFLKDKAAFAVIADKGNIVLVGSKESAEMILAKAAGKKTTKLANKELAALIAKINPKQTIAVALPEFKGEVKIKSITGGVTVTDNVKIDVVVNAADATAAKGIEDMIKEQINTAKDIVGLLVLNQKDFAPAIDILNDIKFESKDATLGIKSDIKGSTLEKLAKAAADLVGKRGIK